MSLDRLVDDVAERLRPGLSPATVLVGAVHPARAEDLPAVVVEVADVAEQGRGLGRVPAQQASGALPVTDEVDLADPRVLFPDGAARLLSEDRRTLHVPHGPLVHADGTADGPFGPGDLSVTVAGTPRPVVPGTPTGDQVQLVADEGRLVFAAPLPATGTVRVTCHVGVWEVRSVRYAALLDLTVVAADPASVQALTAQVEQALSRVAAPLLQVRPVRLGAVGPAALAGASRRVLGVRVDYERVDPLLPGGGGVLTEVQARLSPPSPPSPFVAAPRRAP